MFPGVVGEGDTEALIQLGLVRRVGLGERLADAAKVAGQAVEVGRAEPVQRECVPIASDVDCGGGSGNGPAFVYGFVKVVGSDIYDLDRDNDGYGLRLSSSRSPVSVTFAGIGAGIGSRRSVRRRSALLVYEYRRATVGGRSGTPACGRARWASTPALLGGAVGTGRVRR